MSSGLGGVGFGQSCRQCYCSHQYSGKELGRGREQICKGKGKIKTVVEEITLKFNGTVDAKVKVRQKSGN